jgi:asparagine N-glycosylation enzyme membrane subunit Stt3
MPAYSRLVDPTARQRKDESRPGAARHRTLIPAACIAALFGFTLLLADIHEPDLMSPAGIAIAAGAYASFAVIVIMRWPPWLPVALGTAAAVATTAAGKPDSLMFPR